MYSYIYICPYIVYKYTSRSIGLFYFHPDSYFCYEDYHSPPFGKDIDDDGHPELLLGTEDFEIRALKSEVPKSDTWRACSAKVSGT